MDVYGDNGVNDLKELWETDLEVSANYSSASKEKVSLKKIISSIQHFFLFKYSFSSPYVLIFVLENPRGFLNEKRDSIYPCEKILRVT